MKEYPSISRKIIYGINSYVFDKLDGSNIRAEWDKKKYFHKFGSRTRLLGSDQPLLMESIDLIKSNFEQQITDICKKERYENCTFFFEFYGEHSFAGNHIEEEHTVSLLDVSVYKRGILHPQEYLNLFSDLDIAKLLYHGNITKELEEEIISGKLEGMTFEGVIGKSDPLKNGYPPYMCKIKNIAWVEKLKNFCNENEKLFQELL